MLFSPKPSPATLPMPDFVFSVPLSSGADTGAGIASVARQLSPFLLYSQLAAGQPRLVSPRALPARHTYERIAALGG